MKNELCNLVLKAQRGDEQAFNELYKLYYHQAYYIALKISNCDADAKDAAQETFIEIQRSIPNLKEPDSFKKWMIQIVISKCNKIFRKNKYKVMDPDFIGNLAVIENRSYMSGKTNFESISRKDMILQLMKELTFHQREILYLTYFEQLSIKEMAQMLNVPEGTIKSRMSSAKAALKRKVHDLETREKTRLHIIPFPLLLAMALRSEYTAQFPKLSLNKSAFIKPVLVASVVTTSTIFTGIAYYHIQSQTPPYPEVLPQKLQKNEPITEKDAYFILKDWAHCAYEMAEKDGIDAVILSYYEYLKEKQGAYYLRLQRQGWTTAFDEFYKNVESTTNL